MTVLSFLSIYMLSNAVIPISVVNKMEQLIRIFLRSVGSSGRGVHFLS